MNWKSWWTWLALVWVIGAVAYSNTFSVPFVFDDLVEITSNPALHHFSALWQRYPTRIVTYVTLALNGQNVAGFHAVNLLIHLLTATVIFFLVRELAGLTKRSDQADVMAGITALIFVSHPIQTQAVTYIIQRLSSLTALLYLTGMLSYVLARKRSWKWLYLASFISIMLAMFSKEIAFTAPLAIGMIEVFFWRNWRRALPYVLLLLVIPLTLAPAARPVTAETNTISRHDYILTEINVVRTYLRLLVLPVKQNLDYDYPISHSLFEARTLGSLALLLGVAGLGVWLYPRNRLASFGIFFFFLALSVESSLIPIRDVIYEHRLYLPSFGFFLAAVALAAPYLPRRILLWGGVALVLALTGATLARNTVWQSEVRLWTDVTQKSPRKARGYTNLGAAYVKAGDEDSARPQFERAIQLQSDYAEAYNNLGLLEARAGNLKAAFGLFAQALTIDPRYTHALNNLGVVAIQLGKVEAAIYPLEKALEYDPAFNDARKNLEAARRLLPKWP